MNKLCSDFVEVQGTRFLFFFFFFFSDTAQYAMNYSQGNMCIAFVVTRNQAIRCLSRLQFYMLLRYFNLIDYVVSG